MRYSVGKEVEAISGRDVRLEMEVCSDPIPSKTTWDWGSLRVEAGQVSTTFFPYCYILSKNSWDFSGPKPLWLETVRRD